MTYGITKPRPVDKRLPGRFTTTQLSLHSHNSRHRSLVGAAFQNAPHLEGGSRRILRCDVDLIDDCVHAFVITLFELIVHSHKKKIICRFVLGC